MQKHGLTLLPDKSFPYVKVNGTPLVPYQGIGYRPLTFTDSPEVTKEEVPPWWWNMYASISDSFIDYIIFRPSGSSSIWITLATYSWSWSAKDDYNIFNGWGPVSRSVTAPAQLQTSDEFAQWAKVHQ